MGQPVMGLTPGATVVFRCRPVTKAGEGDWSQPSAIIVKNRAQPEDEGSVVDSPSSPRSALAGRVSTQCQHVSQAFEYGPAS
jgi:hypothetical protein